MRISKNLSFIAGAFSLLAVSLSTAPSAQAADRVMSFGHLPVLAETKDKGILVDMVKAIDKVMGSSSEIGVFPFPRSIDNVLQGKAAYHLPELEDPKTDPASLPFDLSDAMFFKVHFVLYSTKGAGVTLENLATKKIETSIAHTRYFPFNIKGSSNFESSMKKVNAGRIDGFIFAMLEMDSLVEKLKLTNIERQLYQSFEVRAILPKGQKGGETDKYLQAGMDKLVASGEYAKIMGPLLGEYK